MGLISRKKILHLLIAFSAEGFHLFNYWYFLKKKLSVCTCVEEIFPMLIQCRWYFEKSFPKTKFLLIVTSTEVSFSIKHFSYSSDKEKYFVTKSSIVHWSNCKNAINGSFLKGLSAKIGLLPCSTTFSISAWSFLCFQGCPIICYPKSNLGFI